MGVQMDTVSILLLDCWCFFLRVHAYEIEREREWGRGNHCLHVQQGKLEVINSILLKPLEGEGAGEGGETKVTGIDGRESVSLH